MARSKNTIINVTAALTKLHTAREDLQDIDLRTTRGDLREAIREARIAADWALLQCEAAIAADARSLERLVPQTRNGLGAQAQHAC